MNIRQVIIAFLVILSAPAMHCMQERSLRLITNKGDIPGKMCEFINNKDFHEKFIDEYIITNPRVISAIQNNPGEITGRVGDYHMNNLDNLPGFTQKKGVHQKLGVALTYTPTKNNIKKSAFFGGSANATNNVYAHGNSDLLIFGEGYHDLAQQGRDLMTSLSPEKKNKDIILKTPEKSTIYSSKKCDLNTSRAQRILHIAERDGENGHISASSMTFNDEHLAHAFAQAAESGVHTELILDRSSMKNLPLLQKMRNAGVKQYIYDPAYTKPFQCMHVKELLTEGPVSGQFSEVVTGNFTHETNTEENVSIYFRNESPLFDDLKKNHESVKRSCVPFDDALPLYQAAQEKMEKQKKMKRTLSFDKENSKRILKKIKK